VYLKKDLNNVYVCHHLLMQKQKAAEDISQVSYAIMELPKCCVCNTRKAEEFRAELSRDAFCKWSRFIYNPSMIIRRGQLIISVCCN